jgi:hypothetical protein
MRIADDPVAPDRARSVWKSASNVTTTLASFRAISRISRHLRLPGTCLPHGRLRSRLYKGERQWNAVSLDRAATSSRLRKRQDLVVNQCSGEGQCLPNVFVLKFRVFALSSARSG